MLMPNEIRFSDMLTEVSDLAELTARSSSFSSCIVAPCCTRSGQQLHIKTFSATLSIAIPFTWQALARVLKVLSKGYQGDNRADRDTQSLPLSRSDATVAHSVVTAVPSEPGCRLILISS